MLNCATRFLVLFFVFVAGLANVSSEAIAKPVLEVDDFLFPKPGKLKDNMALLSEEMEKGGLGVVPQAMLGIHHLANGNVKLARLHCEEALSRCGIFEPNYCLSLVAFAEKRLDEAVKYAESAILLRPSQPGPYVVLANCGRASDDKQVVVKAMERGREAVPHREEFWEWELSQLLYGMGDLDGALQCIGVLARVAGQDPKVFVQGGAWLKEKGERMEALRMYKTALERAPWYVPAAFGILETLEEDKNWPELVDAADGILGNSALRDAHPRATQMRKHAVETMYKEKIGLLGSRYAVSVEDPTSLDSVDPANALAFLKGAGKVALMLGKPALALPFFRRARDFSSEDPDVLLGLGEAYLATGASADAAPFLKEVLRYQPSSQVHYLLGKLAFSENRMKDCVEETSQALVLRQEYLDALLLQARCLRSLREDSREGKVLERAYKIAPDRREVVEELVAYHMHTDAGLPGAVDFMERLVSLAPYRTEVCRRLVSYYQERERFEDALIMAGRCYGNTPPGDDEGRGSMYSLISALSKKVQSLPLVEIVLDRVCASGRQEACEKLETVRNPEKRVRKLHRSKYRAGRRSFEGELERLGADGADYAVIALKASGFDDLEKQDKLFLFYMNRAAIAGDRLMYIQNHRHALLIKELFETLFAYRKELSRATAGAVHDYLKFVWVNHGQYDHRTGVKFVPRLLTPEMLWAAVGILEGKGVDFAFLPGDSPLEGLNALKQSIFDANYEPVLTVRGVGKDVVLESCVNHFDPLVTQEDVERLQKDSENTLSVRYVRRGGETEVRTYWTQGLEGKTIQDIVFFLKRALPYARSEEQRRSIEALVTFYESGKEEAFREHSLWWLKSHDSTDYLNGFIEQLKDPLGAIGNFEGAGAYVAEADKVDQLADNVGYFEEQMPWPAEFRRKTITKPVSNVAVLVGGTGDMGPVPWAGYNLPNYDDMRGLVGSKNVIFINLLETSSQATLDRMLNEFYLMENRAVVKKWSGDVRKWTVFMHEIIGHGSGLVSPELKENPRVLIGASYSALEEARADLVALYFIGDAKLEAIKAFPEGSRQERMEASYLQFFQGFLTLHQRFHGGQVKEPHYQGRLLIMNFLLAGTERDPRAYGLELEKVNGNYYIQVLDVEKVRTGLGELLVRVQVIKSTGDKEGAGALIEKYATYYDPEIAKNMAERALAIRLPRQSAFVFPHLVPVVRKGEVIDVRLKMDEDLTAQQLRFSRLSLSRELD